METVSSMNVFVSRALQKLQKLASGKKFTGLRDSCQACLDQIESEEKAAAVRRAPVAAGSPTDSADKYFTPFKLACESKNTKLVELSLDCLQKLIAYGYLVGNSPSSEDPSKPLIDIVIQTICNCFDHPEDSVHLQIIKALLTAVTSKHCAVHSSSLLLAVRTCYNIHLVSKNAVNQTTAKAGLTQMLNIIFKRMEGSVASDAVAPPTITINSPESGSAPGGSSSSSHTTGADQSTTTITTETPTLSEKAPAESVTSAPASSSTVTEGVHEEKETATEAAQTTTNTVTDDTASAYGSTSGLARSSIDSTRTATTAMHDDFGGEGAGEAGGVFTDVLQNDAFLLFRALCKLSMKPLPDGMTAESIEMRRRILSLELLLSVLDNSGPVFRSSEKFISAIKQYLCLSLLKNCVSTVPVILRLSLTIFSCLTLHFREHLKNEIGVFFTNVFLRILESSNSNLQQKFIVAQVLHSLCQNPQALLDLFVNYDCDLQALNIFESVVNDLANIVKGSSPDATWSPSSPETSLRLMSLESLIHILRSMVEWANERQPKSPSIQSLKDAETAGDVAVSPSHVRSSSALSGAEEEEKDGASLNGGGVLGTSHSNTNISGSLSMELSQSSAADLVEKRKLMKLDLEKAVSKFNLKPKKGIQYLIKCNLVENTPHDVSQFLRFTEGLNKTAVGEYMGEPDDFNKQVLYAYVDSMDYTGLDFDEALRFFLAGFRIPGEAQKIDRMVEKFAERYITCNPGVFASADTPYKLAYSIIMLNTDAHNPRVKHKMTKHEFLRNNRGIDDGNDLPAEYLSELYDRIIASEIKLKDDEESYDNMEKNSLLSNPKRRQLAFVAESQQMVKKTKEIFQSKKDAASTFLKAVHVEHIRPMFGCCWPPMIAAFSTLLESCDDPTVSRLCLDGLENGIHIAATFYMEAERSAFLSTLIKFTNLGTTREMRQKHLECVKGLVRVAQREGNYLQTSWGEVLRSISEIERLFLRGLGAKPDSAFLQPTPQEGFLKGARRQMDQMINKKRGASTFVSPDQLAQIEDINAANIAAQLDQSEIDRIFSSSGDLNNDAIVDFVKYLCLVSKDEIDAPEPRMFSLQKLVEVAAFNMGRIRLVWSQIWSHMSDHFTSVGCHKNLTLAMYAIDSLRQLAMKFLEKDEFSNFHFQRDFLKPFDFICNATVSLKIRELVICCLAQMVQSRAKNIKSGWKSIFLTFTIAAGDSHDHIVKLAFENTEKIVKDYFSLITDTFVDCVNALIAFACNSVNTKVSLASLDYLRICTQRLVDGQVISLGVPRGLVSPHAQPSTAQESTALPPAATTPVYTDDKAHLRVWFPILTGLSRLVGDSRLDMRMRSLEVLFDILESYGSLFSRGLWELVFRGVLLPVFDDVRHDPDSGDLREEDEWIKTTCMKAMSILVELFSHYFSVVDFLFPDLLGLLASCIKRGGLMLAKIGVTCLVQLILGTGERFSPDTWAQICTAFEDLFDRTSPVPELLSFPFSSVPPPQPADESTKPSPLPFNSQLASVRLSTQLLLISALNDVLFGEFDFLAVSHVQSLIGCFDKAYRGVRQINDMDDLRSSVVKAGHEGVLESVVKLEIQAASAYVRALVSMFTDSRPERSVRRDVAEEPLISFSVEVLRHFVERTNKDSTLPLSTPLKESQSLIPVVVCVLSSMLGFSDEQFSKYAAHFFTPVTELVTVDSKDVRISARDVLLRIGKATNLH